MRKLRAVGKPTADGNIGDRELVACQQLLCGLKALLNLQLLRRHAIGAAENAPEIVIAESGFGGEKPVVELVCIVIADVVIHALQAVFFPV